MEIDWNKMEEIENEEKEIKCIYDREEKEKVRNSIIALLKGSENVVLLESPACLMLKKLLDKGIKNIKIPNNEEINEFPQEFKEYVYPFSLGNFLGNFNLDKIDLVWADFCATWENSKEQIIPLFHRELLNDNSFLIITNSLRASQNNYVSSVLTYLDKISEYCGYQITLMGESSTSGNGMFSIFLKINYANKPRCPKCFSSQVIKRGNRYAKFNVTQRYECKMCDYKFILDANRLRIPEHIRKFIYNKLKEGKSTRAIRDEILKEFNVKISHVSICRLFRDTKRYFGKKVKKRKKLKKIWIKPFTRKMNGKVIQHKGYFVEKEVLSV